jgi:hypothetical protein
VVQRLRKFREHEVHVLGSFIFGLPSDRPSTFDATADVADRAGLAFARFVMLTPFPGTVDFQGWEKKADTEVYGDQAYSDRKGVSCYGGMAESSRRRGGRTYFRRPREADRERPSE